MPRNSNDFGVSRRTLIKAAGASAAVAVAGIPVRLFAADPIKVAAVYTVPVEQQWVSRIHKAANAAKDRGDIEYVYSENTANNDYERVMREYAEAGHKLILGEVFGVEDAARAVAKDYPDVAFLMGSSFKPDAAVPNFSVFDNYIQDASYLTGIDRRRHDARKTISAWSVAIRFPEVNRLMNAFMAGVKEVAKPDVKFQVAFIGSWFDPPKAKETAFAQVDAGADILYAERFGVSDAAKEKQDPRHRQCHRHPGRLSGNGRRLGAVAFRADPRQAAIKREVKDKAPSRPTTMASVFLHEGMAARQPGAARHVRRQGAGRCHESEGHSEAKRLRSRIGRLHRRGGRFAEPKSS